MSLKDENPQNESASTPAPQKNEFAVALGRLGASKGGRARAEKLSPVRRSEIAREAARARWRKNETGDR